MWRDGNSGLQIIDVGNPASPTLLGTSGVTYFAYAVAVSGTLAYLVDSYAGLRILDVSNPASPVQLGGYDTNGDARGVTVSGTVAYMADAYTGINILDVSNPASPVLIDNYATPGAVARVAVSGPLAYAAADLSGLQILEVTQNRFDLGGNVGRSLALDDAPDAIAKVHLATTQVNNVAWHVSANGGATWQPVTPGGWVPLATQGSDLRWRASPSPIPPFFAAVSPEVSRVEVDWLYTFPVVESVADVSNDQGRRVRLDWTRSANDFVGASPQITEYAIYRRIDPGFAPLASNFAATADYSASDAERMEALAAGWDFVTTVPASAEDEYSVLVPTLADSTITSGQHWTAFKIRARTATPGVYYESYADSSYSVDNLSPATPAPFAGIFSGGPSQLHWGANHEADFDHYALHRGGTAGFTPGPGNLVATPSDTGYVDGGSSWSYYKLAAVDVNGNASGYALVTPAASSSGNTPSGNNVPVTVSPIVHATYQHVTGSGQTQVTMQTGGPVPPNGLKVAPGSPPIYYHITSTATFTGTITICITYDPDFISGQEKNLKLMHYDTALIPAQWVQIQTSRDTAANEICGVVTHFSDFALMEMDENGGRGGSELRWPPNGSLAHRSVTSGARIE
jgi:hypothetical protein